MLLESAWPPIHLLVGPDRVGVTAASAVRQLLSRLRCSIASLAINDFRWSAAYYYRPKQSTPERAAETVTGKQIDRPIAVYSKRGRGVRGGAVSHNEPKGRCRLSCTNTWGKPQGIPMRRNTLCHWVDRRRVALHLWTGSAPCDHDVMVAVSI